MAQRPSEKPDWIPDDSTGIIAPSVGKRAIGWILEKPPFQYSNWLWNLLSQWTDRHASQAEEWIVIDSDTDEQDYATLVAWEADSPTAGDKILIKEDQTLTGQFVIPSGVTLKFLDGARLLCSTNIATSVLKSGSDIIIEGVLNLILSQTGVTAIAVELNGDNITGKINIENASTGTLTSALTINAAKTGNKIDGFVDNTGGGTLTGVLTDNAAEDSNNVSLIDAVNNKVIRSLGANTMFSGFKFALGSDANGDIYYRNSGVLVRLPKGTNGDVLRLKSGLPSWEPEPLPETIDIGDWDMDANGSLSVAHGLSDHTKIRTIQVIVRDDFGNIFPLTNGGLSGGTSGRWTTADATNVYLIRTAGGLFDSVSFDSTSYNRGWITITQVP